MEIPRPMRASANVVTWNHSGGPDGTGYPSPCAGSTAPWPDGVSRGAAVAAARTVRLPAGEMDVARAGVGPVRAAAFLACARARACAWARALDFELAIELRFQCLDRRRARGRRLVVGQLADRRGGEVRRGEDRLGVRGRRVLQVAGDLRPVPAQVRRLQHGQVPRLRVLVAEVNERDRALRVVLPH